MNIFFQVEKTGVIPNRFVKPWHQYTPVDLDITTEELMLIKSIHAKFYANAIAIYNASKMYTHEFNKLLGFEAFNASGF